MTIFATEVLTAKTYTQSDRADGIWDESSAAYAHEAHPRIPAHPV